MTTIYLRYSEQRYVEELSEYADPDWDRPNESFSISFGGEAFINPPAYPFDNVDTDEEINLGDDVYFVIVEYGTGDTFGHTSGLKSIEYATKDVELANRIKKAIENGGRPDWYNKSYGIVVDKDEQEWLNTLGLSFCWVGCFEGLEDVEIKYGKVVG